MLVNICMILGSISIVLLGVSIALFVSCRALHEDLAMARIINKRLAQDLREKAEKESQLINATTNNLDHDCDEEYKMSIIAAKYTHQDKEFIKIYGFSYLYFIITQLYSDGILYMQDGILVIDESVAYWRNCSDYSVSKTFLIKNNEV